MSPMHPSAPPLLGRIQGCLLGLAVGDALGAPLQGMKAGRILQIYGRVDDYVEADQAWAKRPGRWTPRGLHASHTQLALALGDSLLAGDDPAEGFRTALLRLAGQGKGPYGCLRALSPAIRAAIRALRDPGQSRPESMCDPAPAVFIVLLGIRHAAAEAGDLIAQAAAVVRTITSDMRAAAAAVAVAEAVRRALRGEWDAGDCGPVAVRSLAAWTREAETRMAETDPAKQLAAASAARHAVSDTLGVIAGLLREGNDDLARRSVAAEAARHEPESPLDDPQAPFAPANVAWALYLALRARQLDSAIAQALAGGRETSAIAALAGAVLGARLGLGAIPAAWRDGLLARGLIERRATAYAESDPSALYQEDLANAESEWTRLESEGRAIRFAALAESESRRQERREARRKPKKPAAPAAPPSTYARPASTILQAVDPEEARKWKALRGRKRIEWKEERRGKKRR